MTPRRAVLALAACLLLPAGPAATGATSAQESRDELRQLRERIGELQKEIAAAEENRSEARDALRESEKAISEANRRLRELEEERAALKSGVERLRKESGSLKTGIEGRQAALALMLERRYAAGRDDFLRLLLDGRDPNRAARHLHYLTYLSRAQADLIGELRDGLAANERVAAEIQAKGAELEANLAEEARQKKTLEGEKAERRKVLAEIGRQLGQQKKEVSRLKKDEDRLTKLVERLAKVIAQQQQQRKGAGVRIDEVPDAGSGSGPFKGLKGKLKLPVKGELANKFGGQRADTGANWKGLMILAQAGEAVRAVAGGRVVYADWLRGFGNLLILDHGDGYMSLYGYNESLLKQVGDAIRGGDTIATVGTSGGGQDSGLYFELRHQGKPIDPLPWTGLR